MQHERALSIELPLPPRSSRLNLQDSKLEFLSYVRSSLSVSDKRRVSAIFRKDKKKGKASNILAF